MQYSRDGIELHYGNVLDLYQAWESPMVIVSDGAYGLGLFEGDPVSSKGLLDWYKPHVEAWTRKATSQTTLWFWNTEDGFGRVHGLLLDSGWIFMGLNIWDKGIAHIAGNCNGQTMRHFPVVTEVCGHYVREPRIAGNASPIQDWLRDEWKRAGLTLAQANDACGVAHAASRKYLTNDSQWYFPPEEMFTALRDYANRHGKEEGRPYFVLAGESQGSEGWKRIRSKFNFEYGATNVWREPALRGQERISDVFHANQKPIRLLERIVRASSDEGDLVWEPFGGLCSVGMACWNLRRRCLSAEYTSAFYDKAVERLKSWTCDEDMFG